MSYCIVNYSREKGESAILYNSDDYSIFLGDASNHNAKWNISNSFYSLYIDALVEWGDGCLSNYDKELNIYRCQNLREQNWKFITQTHSIYKNIVGNSGYCLAVKEESNEVFFEICELSDEKQWWATIEEPGCTQVYNISGESTLTD